MNNAVLKFLISFFQKVLVAVVSSAIFKVFGKIIMTIVVITVIILALLVLLILLDKYDIYHVGNTLQSLFPEMIKLKEIAIIE